MVNAIFAGCGAFTLLIGVGCLIGGAMIDGIVNTAVEEGVVGKLTVEEQVGNAEEPFKGLSKTTTQDYTYVIYNYTNADAILTGAKPILDEVSIKFTKTKHTYDVSINTSMDTYSMRTWSNLNTTQANWDKRVTIVNPVYVAGVGLSSMELVLQSVLAPGFIGQAKPLLETLVADGLKVAGLTGYTASVQSALTEVNKIVPFKNLGGADTVEEGWAKGQDFVPLLEAILANLQPPASTTTAAASTTSEAASTTSEAASTTSEAASTTSEAASTTTAPVATDAPTASPTSASPTSASPTSASPTSASPTSAPTSARRRLLDAETDALIAQITQLKQIVPLFSLPMAINNPNITSVLLNKTSGISVLDVTSIRNTWAGLANPSTMNTSIATIGTKLATVCCAYGSPPDMNKIKMDVGIVANWISNRLNFTLPEGQALFSITKASLVTQYPATLDAASWVDMGRLQFANGLASDGLGVDTVGALAPTPLPIFEFGQYQKLVLKLPPAKQTNLTLDQTKAFLTMFSMSGSPAPSTGFLLAMQTVKAEGAKAAAAQAAGMAAMAAGDAAAGAKAQADGQAAVDAMNAALAPYSSTGVTYLNAEVYYKFLIEYLPGLYQAGLPMQNSGFFKTVTVKEFLHGFTDSFGGGKAFPGYDSPTKTTSEPTGDARSPPSVYYRGVKDQKQFGQFYSDLGLMSFHNMTEIGGSCPSPLLFAADPQASKCHVWGKAETITGLYSPTQVPPLTPYDTPQQSFEGWTSSVMHKLKFQYRSNVEYEGVKLHRYEVPSSEFAAAADRTTEEGKESARNYRIFVTGFNDMTTVRGMVPMALGGPRHVFNPTEAAKFQGKTEAVWETKPLADLETIIDIEPITGKAMFGRQRLQLNFAINAAQFNGNTKRVWFGGVNSTMAFYPIFWAEDGAQITAQQGLDFTEAVYNNMSMGKTLTTVLLALGAIFLLIGVALIVKGVFFSDGAGSGRGKGGVEMH